MRLTALAALAAACILLPACGGEDVAPPASSEADDAARDHCGEPLAPDGTSYNSPGNPCR